MTCINSIAKFYDSVHFQIFNYFARALGFEPRSKVLETRMLPLHHARRKLKAIPTSSGQLLAIYFAKIYIFCKAPTRTCHRQIVVVFLLKNLSHLSCTHCTTTLADSEFQTFLHRNRLDQFYLQ